MVYCAHCGTENAVTGYCQKCGAILERDLESSTTACAACSYDLNADDTYCPGCGAPLYFLDQADLIMGSTPEASSEVLSGDQDLLPARDAGQGEEIPVWLKDYLVDSNEQTLDKSSDQEVWLSDFAELQKSIESSAFLAPDEEEQDQPIDISALLKDLDLATEASALVEQIHSAPPDSHLNVPPTAEIPAGPEAEEPQAVAPLDIESERWEVVPEESTESEAEEIAESAEIEVRRPEDTIVEPESMVSESEFAEPVISEEITPKPAAPDETIIEPEPTGAEEHPVDAAAGSYIEPEDLAESRIALRHLPVSLIVPFKMPQPVQAKTPAGQVFASLSSPQAGKTQAAAGMLSAGKSKSRSGLLLGLALLLLALIIIAYLLIFHVFDLNFTLGSIVADIIGPLGGLSANSN